MSAQDLEQRARELMPEPAFNLSWRNGAYYVSEPNIGDTDVYTAYQVRQAIVAALRQQPAPVDLEQFREIAEGLRLADQFFDGDDSHWQWDDGETFPASKVRAAYKRLLSIIDNAGKVECAEPEQAGVVYQLQDDFLVWSDTDEATFNWWRNSGRRNTRKLYTAPHQPAPVVDDASMARALEWVRTAARGNVGEGDALRAALIESARTHLPAIEEAIAAYDPNCGARTVRVVDDAMRSLIEASYAVWYDTLGATTGGKGERLRAALARAQAVQS